MNYRSALDYRYHCKSESYEIEWKISIKLNYIFDVRQVYKYITYRLGMLYFNVIIRVIAGPAKHIDNDSLYA